MRAKEPFIVVAFDATTAALGMEQAARMHGLRGRLVPVPRQLSAGCGMAWREPADNEDALRRVLAAEGIDSEQVVWMEL